jgi:hypothetical protein
MKVITTGVEKREKQFWEDFVMKKCTELDFFYLWVPVANAPGCTAACRLIVQPEILDVPTCTTRCPACHNDASDPSSERRETAGKFGLKVAS